MLCYSMIMDCYSDDQKEKLANIYQSFKENIYRIAFDILNDYQEAEDVVHSVIIKVAKNLDKIDIQDFNRTASYISIITKNSCYDIRRKKRGIDIIPVDLMEQQYPELFSHHENYSELLGKSNEWALALSKVNELYADIIALRYFHALKIKEISELLGITENNASVRLHRAVSELKKIISMEGLTDEKNGTR